MPCRFDAVIFDCDGVLVDSEVISARIWVEMASELGCELPYESTLERLRGGELARGVAWLESLLGRAVPDGFVRDFRRRSAARFERELRPIEGVEGVLGTLEVPICVASNGPREKMDVSLSVTGLGRYFEGRVVSAYEVGVFKPDPGLFLAAAELLGVAPQRCAVVEDSLPGVQAAIGARMQAFAYADADAFALHRSNGAVPFARMQELPELLI